MNPILEIKGLSKSYKNFSLQSVDLSVPTGSIVGLIGENGAGKTTLIKSMLDIVHRDSGTVEIFGKEFDTHREEILQDIAVVFDGNTFPGKYSAQMIENIYRRIYKQWDSSLYHRYLEEFRIDSTQAVEDYSKGMKMKLSIASALAHNPKLLILDEATGGLDPVVRSEILDLFQEFILDAERSVIFSSHITSDLEKIADYVAFLHQGKLQFVKNKDELLYSYGLAQVGKETFSQLDTNDWVAYRPLEYGYQVLTKDKSAFEQKYKELSQLIISRPTIDDIMLLYVKGVK